MYLFTKDLLRFMFSLCSYVVNCTLIGVLYDPRWTEEVGWSLTTYKYTLQRLGFLRKDPHYFPEQH